VLLEEMGSEVRPSGRTPSSL